MKIKTANRDSLAINRPSKQCLGAFLQGGRFVFGWPKKCAKRVIFSVFLLSLSAVQSAYAANTQASQSQPRIVALSPHIVELLFEIGAGDQIIGTSDFADYPEAAKSIPVVGNYLGLKVEKILTMKPDVIIAWKTGGARAQLAQLEKMGINVVYSAPETPHDIAKDIRFLGEQSNNRAKAEQVALAYEKELNRIQIKYKRLAQSQAYDLASTAPTQSQAVPLSGGMLGGAKEGALSETAKPVKKGIRVFYELWPQPLTTVSKGSWNQSLLDVCQVENVFYEAAAPFPQVNIEQVMQRQVEVIIQPISQEGDGKALFDWQRWPIIPAVKQQRILTPDADKLHRMTVRMLSELDKLCDGIYNS